MGNKRLRASLLTTRMDKDGQCENAPDVAQTVWLHTALGNQPDAVPTPDLPDLELSLSASPENVAVVRHVLGGIADALDMAPDRLADVRLAVSEACANAVIHAYPEGAPGLLDFEVSTGPDLLEIVVRDHGSGMMPRADSPGFGVGLPLIASVTDGLELANRDDGGTEVRMSFSL